MNLFYNVCVCIYNYSFLLFMPGLRDRKKKRDEKLTHFKVYQWILSKNFRHLSLYRKTKSHQYNKNWIVITMNIINMLAQIKNCHKINNTKIMRVIIVSCENYYYKIKSAKNEE